MHHYKKSVLALGLLLSGSAMADVGLHFAGTAGLSYGGDTLAKIQFTNGDHEQIKAGSLFYIAGGPGLEFRDTPWSAQVLYGYHFDESSADNGKVKFDRKTLEGQVFYRIGDNRLGLGLVQHLSPEYSDSFNGYRVDFKDTTGVSFEYNWLPLESKVGFSARVVLIDYETKKVNGMTVTNGESFSGNHAAVGLYLYL